TRIRKISAADPSHEVTTVLELQRIGDFVVSCDGILYLAVNLITNGLSDGYLYRLNKDGKLKLVYRTPQLISAVAVATDKTLYLGIIDFYGEMAKIEKISPDGNVTLLAGGEAGYVNGPGSVARFREITKMVLGDNNTLYASDASSHTIRKITSAGEVTTLAGRDLDIGINDGTGINARFNYPIDIAIDKAGNLYTSDYSYGTIRKINPQGVVTTLCTLDFWTHSLAEHDGTLYIPGEDSFIKKVKLN
ncbi:MAG: repeat containing protein, partial [Daejeonella sp.]|nr:repeat containing protein [Daejeonella sp.]